MGVMSTGKRIGARAGKHASRAMAALLAGAFLLASAPAYSFLARPAVFAAIASAAKAPGGWLQFCAKDPGECKPSADASREIILTPELLQQLYTINKYVNDRVKWTSDAELYGMAENWTYPLDRGDCDDIVLLKRKLLAKAGWPMGSLLITTVDDPNLGRHAVLTVRSDRGEMILDNQTPEILFWYDTPYRYLTRQSPADPNVWVAFADQPRRPPPVTR